MDVSVEQVLTFEFDTMRHADITHVTALSSDADCLHHRFLSTNTLQHGIRTDSFGQIHDPLDPFFTALGHDVGGAEFTRELLP